MITYALMSYAAWIAIKPAIIALAMMYPSMIVSGYALLTSVVGYTSGTAISIAAVSLFML